MRLSDLKVGLYKLLGRQARILPLPHYVRDYRRHVQNLLQTAPEDAAMALAVGGEFQSFGIALKDFVVQCGLKESMTLIDVGCGSGRLAYALRNMKIDYTGTDVVPELVEYAKKLCRRPDWRFEISTDLTIPAADNSADMVVFVSVFTHLRHEEAFLYLMEAKRVLKPKGIIVFTFFDFGEEHHWIIFQSFANRIKSGIMPPHVDQFIDKSAISIWAQKIGLDILNIFDGHYNYIRLSQEVTRDDGSKLSGDMTIGQSACVLQKL